MADYTENHARAGIETKLPKLATWPNQYPGYVITTRFPEYTSVCPKTGMPDYGTITIQYMPRRTASSSKLSRCIFSPIAISVFSMKTP